jgi:serine/threonine-protein kinase
MASNSVAKRAPTAFVTSFSPPAPAAEPPLAALPQSSDSSEQPAVAKAPARARVPRGPSALAIAQHEGNVADRTPEVATSPALASSTPGSHAAVRPAGEKGYLSLDSSPWANVFFAGKALGPTPLVRVPMPAGRHVLTLENPETGRSTAYVVDIHAGQGTSRFIGWEKE